MELEELSRLSYYRELAPLNAEHDVMLVQHSESGVVFVRKTLVNYQPEIFRQLMAHPIPNMPRIVEAVEDEGRLIVIETFLSGITLQKMITEKGIVTVHEACRIAEELCDILSVLHGRGIIHRDIKPSNIILSEDGVVKLLDLDAAKVFRRDENRDTKLIGTHGYAAPEQYGFGASSPMTDIYAVGALLNVLTAGDLPGGKAPADERLCGVIRRCTKMEPEERYRSAAELKAALQAVEAPPEAVRMPDGPAEDEEEPQPAARDGWKSFLLPGFRGGTIWKMILAVLWYWAVAQLTISFLVNPPAGSSRFDSIAEASMALCFGISLPLFLFNYRNAWKTFHIDRIESKIGRQAVAVLCAVLLTFLLTMSMAAIGSLLMKMGLIPPE